MSAKSYVRFERGERAQLSDFTRVAQDTPIEAQSSMGGNFLLSEDSVSGESTFVLEGWEVTDPATGKDVEIFKGRAVASVKNPDGTITRGLILVEGPDSQTIDITSLGAGTYGVYVRLELQTGESQNRLYWDPATPGEYAQATNTRRTASWSMKVTASSPGDEWLHLYDVDQASMAFTDKRYHFFEGSPETANPYESAWGGGNDRDNDRATHGVKDLQTFVEATKKKIEEIQGVDGTNPSGDWWLAPQVDMGNLYASDGSREMTGTMILDADNTYDIGATGTRHRTIYGRDLDISGTVTGGTLFISGSSASYILGTADIGIQASGGGNLILSSGDDLTLTGSAKLESISPHLFSNTATTVAANKLTGALVPIAWAYIDNTTSGSPAIDSGVNITSATVSSADILYVIDAGAATTGINNYIVVATTGISNVALYVTKNSNTTFRVAATTAATGAPIDPSGTNIRPHILVFGLQ